MKKIQGTVIAVKKSELRKNVWYLTIDATGLLKVAATKKYEVGDRVWLRRKNAVDFVFEIDSKVEE